MYSVQNVNQAWLAVYGHVTQLKMTFYSIYFR